MSTPTATLPEWANAAIHAHRQEQAQRQAEAAALAETARAEAEATARMWLAAAFLKCGITWKPDTAALTVAPNYNGTTPVSYLTEVDHLRFSAFVAPDGSIFLCLHWHCPECGKDRERSADSPASLGRALTTEWTCYACHATWTSIPEAE